VDKVIVVRVKEANLLRSQTRRLLAHRKEFLTGTDPEALHDLRVASRRMREVLENLQSSLPDKWQVSLLDLGRRITKSLGNAREAEVNLKVLQHFSKDQKLSPVSAEILMRRQSQHLRSSMHKARNRISEKKFSRYEKFLMLLKGSFSLQSVESPMLLARREAFLGFVWEGEVDDDRLHDLRIRTKKFRYSLEIYDRLHERNLGRLLHRMKSLQDVLGTIHDLYVFGELVRAEHEHWKKPALTVIPMALQKTYETVLAEKERLYPRVFPLYSSIVSRLPQHLSLFKGALASSA
jgi:CHAD domain-containing protein